MKRLAAVLLVFMAVPLVGICATPCDLLGLQAQIAAQAESHWRALSVQAGETIARIEGHLLTSANPEVVSQVDQFRAQVAALQGQQARYLELAEAARKAAEALRALWLACTGEQVAPQGHYKPITLMKEVDQPNPILAVEAPRGVQGWRIRYPDTLPDIPPQPDAGTGSTSTQELTITEYNAVQDALGK